MHAVLGYVAMSIMAVIVCASPARADATAETLIVAQAGGTRQNDPKRLELLRESAARGEAWGQSYLGLMYYVGQGVPKNYAEAARWFRKAAEQGVAWVQSLLGGMYLEAQGVPKNPAEAARWFREAADQGYADAQTSLGLLYEVGMGVPRDYVQAYVWFNIAAASGHKLATQHRDQLEHLMTVQQIAEGERRTAAWQPKHSAEQQPTPPASAVTEGPAPNPFDKFDQGAPPASAAKQEPTPTQPDDWFVPEPPASVAKQEPALGQLGTGFFIGEAIALTNAHVVEGCSKVAIGPPDQRVTARVAARDKENDLALLRAATHPAAVAALRLSVRQGEAVAAYGYPLPGLLASGGNLTTGNITALSGIGDDSRLLQISVPVQPGNSGGPLLDNAGNVVGIVEGKLNAIKIATALGDVPQNVNFAIKASVVATFLDSNGIGFAKGEPAAARSPADIAEDARRFTVLVECGGSPQ